VSGRWRLSLAALRFVPLIGILVGLVSAGTYWLAAQIWPTNVAVVVSMIVTALVTANLDESSAALDASPADLGAVYWVFVILIKYNALMALSAAHVPFFLPEYLTLGLIMVAGQAASRALVVSVMATDVRPARRVTSGNLTIALILGLAPAALLGIPGLIGLVAAIVMRLGLAAKIVPKLQVTQQLTEVSFYLGALAAWKYI
jgi:adenosylcobinamide-GDP ribazoletransferase